MSIQDEEKTDVKVEIEDAGYPRLEILAGPKTLSSFPLKQGKNQMGRSSQCDIILDDSSVSRNHAILDVKEKDAVLSDLGSRNGTKIKGRKITSPIPVPHGTIFKVGLFELRYLTQPDDSLPPPEPMEEGPVEEPVEEPPVEGEIEAPPPPQKKKKPAKPVKKWPLFVLLGVVLTASLVLGGKKTYKFFGLNKLGTKKTTSHVSSSPTLGGVIPSQKVAIPEKPKEVISAFLDFSSQPLPAQVFFGNQLIGMAPLRSNTTLKVGKWYEVRGLFQLPEVGEVIEEKIQFTPQANSNIIPLAFEGKVGVLKVARLPREAQLYFEGYFEKDPYRPRPIKFAEIVFGKPVYMPFGKYVMELRKSRQVGISQTYLDEVVYRREFTLNKGQTTYTVDVNDEALSIFPAEIRSAPGGAKIFLDEKEVGVTPYQGPLTVGQHLLTVKKEGYFDFIQPIKMEINMPYVAEIQLKTSDAGALINQADTFIRENRYTEALPLLIDAYSKNPSPSEAAQISYRIGLCYLKQRSFKEARDYFLKTMEHPDYNLAGRLGIANISQEEGDQVKALQLLIEILASSEDPRIRADAGALFNKISPLKSVLYVTSEPAGAKVFVNGTELAQPTPLILYDMGIGPYRVQLKKEGYEETEVKLNLGISEFRPVVAQLKKVP